MSAHADIDVFLGGQPLAALRVKPGIITVHEVMSGHASFSLECMALDEGVAGAVSGSQPDLDALFKQIGKEFKVVVLSPDRLTTRHTLSFTGLVMDVRAMRQRGGGYRVMVEGRSRSVLMDMAPKFMSLKEDGVFKLKDLFDKKAETYGDLMSYNVPDTEPIPLGVIQYTETDFAYLCRLCERSQVWVFFDGARMQFTTQLPDAEVELTMGNTQFENSLDTLSVTGMIAQGTHNLGVFDFQKGEEYFKTNQNTALAGELHPWADRARQAHGEVVLRNTDLFGEWRLRSLSELEAYLTNLKKSWASHLVQIRGTSSNADLRIAKRVKVTGVAETQSGKYVVVRVSHFLDATAGTYSNEFDGFPESGAFPEWLHPRPQAREMLTGQVVDTNGGAYSNERMGQVKVRLFISPPEAYIWARVAQPYAGANGGFFTMPEVGDEVLVMFEDGDPTRPVVVGSVYTKNQSKVFEKLKEVDKNMGKGLLTKEGNKILIQDEKGKETIVISTPDDKNIVKLSMDGGAHISVVTNGHLSLQAGGSISMRAGGDINMHAGKKVISESAEETEINAKGKMEIFSEEEILVSANNEIDLECGASGIEITPAEIKEVSAMIKLN